MTQEERDELQAAILQTIQPIAVRAEQGRERAERAADSAAQSAGRADHARSEIYRVVWGGVALILGAVLAVGLALGGLLYQTGSSSNARLTNLEANLEALETNFEALETNLEALNGGIRAVSEVVERTEEDSRNRDNALGSVSTGLMEAQNDFRRALDQFNDRLDNLDRE